MCLPTGSTELLLETWQTKVFNLLVAARWVDQHTVDQMRMWAPLLDASSADLR